MMRARELREMQRTIMMRVTEDSSLERGAAGVRLGCGDTGGSGSHKEVRLHR